MLGMICLESLGYFSQESANGAPRPLRAIERLLRNRHVVIVSNLRSIRFGVSFLTRFFTSGLLLTFPAALPTRWVPAIELSDHRGYWEQGFPALMITDTAFMRNPHYHQPTDRLATLDMNRMTRLCAQLQKAVYRMCR
jgi:hypothetical protein